jgi:tRNA U34 5-methylaminomethyl-2-thiouridine-forming methyltransferase MnmC
LETFEIVTLRSGIKSLRSVELKETFHPVTGPLQEARLLHVEQQRLVERCSAMITEDRAFVIWDIGFGAAANLIAATQALRELNTRVEIHSFDRSTAPIAFALGNSLDLDYVRPYEQQLKSLIAAGSVEVTRRLSWRFHLGDFTRAVSSNQAPAPHAVIYDPYSPATNPDMWTLEHFRALRARLSDDAPCVWTNYSRSTAVRATLLLAGFYVGQGWAVGEKAETTVASNRLELLRAPLDRAWLERARRSTNAAPFRESSRYEKAPISLQDFGALERLPQFL